ncbi:hypothetical protein C5Y96_19620 [Blastopirellula marina]|uniref:Uncharacterized protein n=1 Tax=Blastopirellula marina TaxID=124 RepID=A0A2S8F3F0_9BACT|nr:MULTISPECIES: hypothetical protein [Pirellulaceae]PQO26696.1 hypothetical protein C5Y96_19620 [Blastopirellula marina]RCS46175.1 hypothetical protein DTL36_19650 [Bremerella cremea]
MDYRYALAGVIFGFLTPLLLQGQEPVGEKNVIVIPLDTMVGAKRDGDLLTWIHFGSVKFGGTDPVYRIRVLKDGTAIVPPDNRQRESQLKLSEEEVKSLRKVLLADIDLPTIAGPWFNSEPNRWDGSQDCFLVRDAQKPITLTCEYGWPSSSANQDLMIQRYLQVMQTYTDLIYLVRAGGKEAIARQLPLANKGLQQHLPEAAPLTIEDFAYGEDFPDRHRRLTFVREEELAEGQWEKIRIEVLVPDEGKPRLGDITINGKRS